MAHLAGHLPIAGTRDRERWVWRTMDMDDRVTGTQDGVESGRLNFNINADIRGAGSFVWSGDVADLPDWRHLRISPVYTATLVDDGSVVEWPRGVFVCARPVIEHHAGGLLSAEFRLYDKTLLLRRARVTTTTSYAAGTVVTDAIRTLLTTYVGGTIIVEDSTDTLRAPLVFEAGTTVMAMVTELGQAIGYGQVWADPTGALRAEPYVRPADRPEGWAFVAGSSALHAPDMSHEADDFDTPNRVTAVSSSTGDVPVLTSTLALGDIMPTHPLTAENLGGDGPPIYNDRFEDNVEVANQGALDNYVHRLLIEGVSKASTLELVHAPLDLYLGDRVTTDVIASATVQTIDIECSRRPTDWTTVVREVIG